MTTKCAFKIGDPSRGPGRVDLRSPDEEFGLEGTPKPKIQRDPSAQKGSRFCGPPLYSSYPINALAVPNNIIVTLCYAILLPGWKSGFRAGNRSSRQDFGRMLVGRASKSALRPAEGRPEGRFRGFPDVNPL